MKLLKATAITLTLFLASSFTTLADERPEDSREVLCDLEAQAFVLFHELRFLGMSESRLRERIEDEENLALLAYVYSLPQYSSERNDEQQRNQERNKLYRECMSNQ